MEVRLGRLATGAQEIFPASECDDQRRWIDEHSRSHCLALSVTPTLSMESAGPCRPTSNGSRHCGGALLVANREHTAIVFLEFRRDSSAAPFEHDVCLYRCRNLLSRHSFACKPCFAWYVCSCVYVCMHACMLVCRYACMYTCKYACMYVCMYACLHVCM